MPSRDRPTGETTPDAPPPRPALARAAVAGEQGTKTPHRRHGGAGEPELEWASDPAILAILDRAAALSPAEMVQLAAGLREGSHAPRTIRIAVARAGRSVAAQGLAAEVAAAVQRAARTAQARRALASLGILFDAGLIAGDAALAVLVADHLSADVAARLSAPWTSVVEASPCRS